MNHKPLKYQDETKVHPALREYFGYCLYKAAAVHRSLLNEALEEFEIQTHHYGILKILNLSGPTSQIDLGNELGIDKASMVKAIDHLEDRSYVIRKSHPTDRRIKTIHITKSGKKILDANQLIKSRVESKFFKKMNADDRATFMRLLTMVLPEPISK